VTSTHHDGATNQRLRLLVGLVVVCSVGTFALALSHLPLTRTDVATGILATAFIAIAHLPQVEVRVGANHLSLSPALVAVLVCTAFLQPSWVIISATLGTFAIKMIARQEPIKIGFNTGKKAMAAAVAVAAPQLAGITPILAGETVQMPTRVLAIAASAIGYALVDEALSVTLLALVTGTSVRQRMLMHLDASLIVLLAGFLVSFVTVWAYAVSPWLMIGLPFVVYALHLASANQVRGRTEREAWQRLSQATDELNTVDLEHVVQTAVRRAAELFSADEVDLELRPAGLVPRLLRGDHRGIHFDGEPGAALTAYGHVTVAALDGGSGASGDVGELRLRFNGPVTLSEREQFTLLSFAAALSTAVRNAITFAETRRLADSHARAAAQDPLTGLANRRRLHEYGTDVLERAAGVETALLLIDLNHFKEVNETLGHAAGDRLLVEVGRRLDAAVDPDDLVARLGGDEFAVLFVGLTAPALAITRSHGVLAALDAPVDLDGMSIGIEASGGVATTPSVGGVDELLRRADVAMYRAKQRGQRVAAYARSRDTANVGSLTLGGNLLRAINQREFTVDFQPIVDLATGEAIGAEALARWQHPDRGLLGPDQFLDGIERSGLLPAFAGTILDQALTAVRKWSDAGFPIPVAVNVSPRSLLDPTFPSTVEDALTEHGLPADTLVLELTESVTLSQRKVVDEALSALRTLGVRLALDDFGTGYSSLSTLARVPVYELKIDRSFVSEMRSQAAGAVVRSTIDLARSLDLFVVAEGVETEEQRRMLWELGCPAAQGHLFARPMATHRLVPLLRRGAGGRPGTLAAPIHGTGSVIRMPKARRNRGDQQRRDRSG
jgi:diguanylate cyclase (GGDEF)-like protein